MYEKYKKGYTHIKFEDLRAIALKLKLLSNGWMEELFPYILKKVDSKICPGLKIEKIRFLLHRPSPNEYLKKIFVEAASTYFETHKKKLIKNLEEEIKQKQKLIDDLSQPLQPPGEAAKPPKSQ